MSAFVRGDLQCSQQVAGLPQSGPGGVQLLQQLVLRLFQCADLSLSFPNVLLSLLYALLQPEHLGGAERIKTTFTNLTGCVSEWQPPRNGTSILSSARWKLHQKCIADVAT